MNRLFSLVLALFILISLTGCKIEDLPFLNKDTQTSAEDEELKYKIDQVILSKGYESIVPKVEVVKKSSDIRLLVSVGLLETSGVSIEQIVKKGNVINIHVVNQIDEEKIQLAVPQIILDLKNTKSINLEEIKFNIINENYDPINIKFGITDVINMVKSSFHLTPNTSPEVILKRIDDILIWNVTYNSIFDKDNLETPLVNLSVDLDANTGKILKSTKGLISSYIDEGNILDYIPDKYVLYRRNDHDFVNNTEIESIWYYDIMKNEKTQIYHTLIDITAGSFSPDSKYISVIENNGTASELYVITKDEKKAFKVLFENTINPLVVRWYNNDSLYILVNNDINKMSNIYSYNVKTNEQVLVSTIYKDLVDIRTYGDTILLMENVEESLNNNIYFTRGFDELKSIDTGFYTRLINENLVAYIKKSEKSDRNLLYIYDINDEKEYDVVDLNAISAFAISENALFIVEKNQNVNDFNLYEYIVDKKDLSHIAKFNTENIYYSKEKSLLFVDLTAPFDTEKPEIIYSVDLTKLSSLQP